MEGTFPLDDHPDWPRDNLAAFGSRIAAPVIANGGFNGDSASDAVRRRGAAMVSFGQAFIANPDLPRRLREDLPLGEADPATSYGSSDAGYIDYPFYTDPDATRRPALAA